MADPFGARNTASGAASTEYWERVADLEGSLQRIRYSVLQTYWACPCDCPLILHRGQKCLFRCHHSGRGR